MYLPLTITKEFYNFGPVFMKHFLKTILYTYFIFRFKDFTNTVNGATTLSRTLHWRTTVSILGCHRACIIKLFAALINTVTRQLYIGLYHPLDGVTNLKYKLLCFLTPNKIILQEKGGNQDRCCHLALC